MYILWFWFYHYLVKSSNLAMPYLFLDLKLVFEVLKPNKKILKRFFISKLGNFDLKNCSNVLNNNIF